MPSCHLAFKHLRAVSMKRPAGQQKFRASPAHGHKCQVCGANGHDLRTCKFPGAALVKKLLQEQGRKSRQTGRRPVRFGPRTQEAQKESRTKKYTGVTSKQKRLRERKEGFVCGENKEKFGNASAKGHCFCAGSLGTKLVLRIVSFAQSVPEMSVRKIQQKVRVCQREKSGPSPRV